MYVLFLIPAFIVQVTELVQFENSTVNIIALCNSCEAMVCCSSECVLTFLYVGDNIQYVKTSSSSRVSTSFLYTSLFMKPPINKNITGLSPEILVAS